MLGSARLGEVGAQAGVGLIKGSGSSQEGDQGAQGKEKAIIEVEAALKAATP